ncbi:hypothetical protein ACFS32_12640 [Novosphingobium pokkalii]|uniref:hypothetical protein n=1 Tax=Novosphingobium pokkalii TaxID=1770194 RepID=UPI0036352EA5
MPHLPRFLPALVAAAALLPAPAHAASPALAVTFAPRADVADRARVGTVEVTLRLSGLAAKAGAPVLQLPLVASNVDTVASLLGPLRAHDAAGPLLLRPRDAVLADSADGDAVSGGPGRQWLAPRAIRVRSSSPIVCPPRPACPRAALPRPLPSAPMVAPFQPLGRSSCCCPRHHALAHHVRLRSVARAQGQSWGQFAGRRHGHGGRAA